MMPDTCICRDGWTGPNCTECVPYWNCQHGSCKKPWECNCDPGYFGLECNDTKTVGIRSSYLFCERALEYRVAQYFTNKHKHHYLIEDCEAATGPSCLKRFKAGIPDQRFSSDTKIECLVVTFVSRLNLYQPRDTCRYWFCETAIASAVEKIRILIDLNSFLQSLS